jgi:hypothetical protein
MDWTYFASKVFQFFVLACDDLTSPNPVPVKPARTKAKAARRGRLTHRIAEKLRNGAFDDPGSRTAILLHTSRWKSGGISGCTFHEVNFFLSSSSILIEHRVWRKPSSFFKPEKLGHHNALHLKALKPSEIL